MDTGTDNLKVDVYTIYKKKPPYINGLFFPYYEAKSHEGLFLAQITDSMLPEELANFMIKADAVLHEFDCPLFLRPKCSYETSNQCVFIYEHCNAGSLDSVKEPYNDDQIRDFLHQMVKSLSIIHNADYIIRALTPSAIFMNREKNGQISYKLGDIMPILKMKEKSAPRFSPNEYIAPEVTAIDDPKKITGAADIYSLGIILKTLLTGSSEVMPKAVNPTLEHLIKRCTQPDYNTRIPLCDIIFHPFMSQPGRFDKCYLDHKFIGKGGFGKVFKAKSTIDGKECAVKLFDLNVNIELDRFDNTLESRELSLIHREITFMYHVQSAKDPGKNLGAIIDHFLDGKNFYIVMDYYAGGSLNKVIKLDKYEKGLPPKYVIKFAKEIILGLKSLHSKRIIHRDLKPENILLTSEDLDKTELRVMDFGISKKIEDSGGEMSFLLESSSYAPPEIYSDGMFNWSYDIWAFGVILYEMITGRHPAKRRDRIVEGKEMKGVVDTTGQNKLRKQGKIERVPIDKWPNLGKMYDLIEECVKLDKDQRKKAEKVIETLSKF